MTLTRSAKMFIGFMAMTAAIMAVSATAHRQAWHPALAMTLLVIATATSRMKVKLPGLNGNMSVNLPFLLLSVVTLNGAESMLIACVATIVQTLPKQGTKLKPVQLLFNVCMIVLASGAAGMLFHAPSLARLHWFPFRLQLAATTATFFLGQTVPISVIVSLTDGGVGARVWASIAQLTFPYYVLSAGVTSIGTSTSHLAVSLAAVMLLPVMYGIYRSYRIYFAKEGQETNQPLAIGAAAGANR